jgi:hypothetical protein
MQARSAQQRNVIVGHTSTIEFTQNRRDDDVIGTGARGIRKNDAHP